MSKSPTWSFDLERAIATWRQFVSRDPAIRPDDLDELESHLRDETARLMTAGMAPQAAFDAARADLGNVADLGDAYGAVHHEKRFRKGSKRREWAVFVGMMGSYVRLAWRGAVRHPGYTMLNVAGLSLALAAALVIGLFIRYSLSYDRHLPAADRTYRVLMHRGAPEASTRQAFTTVGLADLIRSQWAGAELVTEATGASASERLFTVDDVHHSVDRVLSVDDHFPSIFPVAFPGQEFAGALDTPGSMVLTESTARRLFGMQNPVGQTVRFEARMDLTVTAVVEDPAPQTHMPYNVLIRGFTTAQPVSWNSIGSYIFVVLQPGADPGELATFLSERYASENPGALGSYSLQPVTEVHLDSGVLDDYAAQGARWYLTLFGTIGALILALACINYVNLATSRATRRIREVGVRKVVGATQHHLRGQFLLEALLTTLLAVPLAVLLAVAVLPMVSGIAAESLSWPMLFTPGMLGLVLAYVILLAVGAGVYPAVLMARKPAAEIFSGSRSFGRSRITVRQILVGTQVGIAFSLIAMTLIISAQLDVLRNDRLGFDQDMVVTLSPRDWSDVDVQGFVAEVSSQTAVASAAAGMPLGIGWRYFTWTETPAESEVEVHVEGIPVGVGFIETMGITLVAGRAFADSDQLADPLPVVVSREYAEAMGGVELVIGQTMRKGGGGEIIGVVEEFRNASFKADEHVAVLQLDPTLTRYVVVKLRADQVEAGLDVLDAAWSRRSPDRPMVWSFLDERIQAQYVQEARFASIFLWFSGLSIAIAVFGLVGLAALSARQRDKEIAIRKSLGAPESSILLLLNREFLAVLGVGMVCAAPLVWMASNRWLDGFSQRLELDGSPFLLAALICVGFVLLSVNLQSLRAARANPVHALKWD